LLLCLVALASAYQPRSDRPTRGGGGGVGESGPGSLSARARPEPLTADEERLPLVQELARRFNPAMAFPIPDIWPVDVSYAWHDGADLVARVEDSAHSYVAVPGRALARSDWSRLPHHAPDGRAIRYYLDVPGDDQPSEVEGLTRWRQRWRQIVQPRGRDRPPGESAYPPTQYAHLYWWNRAAGLLAVQYWFYYPFNEWVNRHEGDWEHIQIVLAGPGALAGAAAEAYAPVGHQFFFHTWWNEPTQMVRLKGRDPGEDHPLVYVGGFGRTFLWSGVFSGGSFPLPGRFAGVGHRGFLAADDDTSRPARFIAAGDFKVVVLPEPARLDGRRSPALSWLRLPFFAGQRHVTTNPPGYQVLGRDHPPVQPGVRRAWLSPPEDVPWRGEIFAGPDTASAAEKLPPSWACVRPHDPASCAGAPPPALSVLEAQARSPSHSSH
jgi:hypothetical protein